MEPENRMVAFVQMVGITDTNAFPLEHGEDALTDVCGREQIEM